MSTRSVTFRYSGQWRDDVGSALSNAAEGLVKNFNSALKTMWHNLDQCKDIDPKAYHYEPQKEKIWGMRAELK